MHFDNLLSSSERVKNIVEIQFNCQRNIDTWIDNFDNRLTSSWLLIPFRDFIICCVNITCYIFIRQEQNLVNENEALTSELWKHIFLVRRKIERKWYLIALNLIPHLFEFFIVDIFVVQCSVLLSGYRHCFVTLSLWKYLFKRVIFCSW